MTAELSSLLLRVVGLAVGCALIGLLWWLGLRRLRSIRRAEITDAVVIEMLPVQSARDLNLVSHIPKLKFRTRDGTEQVVTRVYSSSRLLRPEFQVGQRVRIVYDPATGSAEIFQPGFALRWLASLVLLTLAIVGIMCVLLID